MHRIASSLVCTGTLACFFAGCVASPPSPPPRPLTKDEAFEIREQNIQKAVSSAYLAGRDGLAVNMSLHLLWCQRDAQELTDAAQRSAALQQCRVDWPQPVQQAQQQVTTSCYSQGGVTQCTSQ
jgi:hypothetical protein